MQVRNIKITLSYDGSEFHGWQIQPGLATVQSELVSAIRRVTGETVVVHGSGRTDAGVHALAQVANFRLAAPIPVESFARALNAILPRSIRVLSTEKAASDFHARRDARSKQYRYRIYRGDVCPPCLRDFVYHHPYRLNEERMIASAPAFTGTHDFTSFAARPESLTAQRAVETAERDYVPHESARGNVRTVFASVLQRKGAELLYEIEGSGFLHHMVRNIVGLLLEIGAGLRRAEEIPAIFTACRRSAAGRTAPARGLYLVRVNYDAAPAPDANT